MMTDSEEKGYGNCALFAYEGTDGVGLCYFYDRATYCGDCCDCWIEENTDENHDEYEL